MVNDWIIGAANAEIANRLDRSVLCVNPLDGH